MNRVSRSALTTAGIVLLAGCGTATPEASSPAPTTSPPASPSRLPSPSPSPSPSAAPTTRGPKLVNADLSELENFSITLGKPVVISTTTDAGAAYHLGSRPDSTVDFSATSTTESTRMKLRAAKVRKRTDDNKNTLVIVASPVVAGSGPESCVTDKRKGVLRLEPCRPGDAAQAWHLTPAGDSGLFELTGAHTPMRVDKGKLTDDGWSALETSAVTS